MDKLGIVFSGRVRSALLGALALWVLLAMAGSALRIIGAYFGGAGFDTTVHDVIVIDILIFLPYYTMAAVMLRSLTARIALFHRLRRQIVTPEYAPTEVLSPAEAGLLVDNDFTFNELAATLKDLELRGCIAIAERGVELEVRPLDLAQASPIEHQFINTLCPNGFFTTNSTRSAALFLNAGRELADASRQELVRGGQLPASRVPHKAIRTVVHGVIWFAVLVQALLTWGVINSTHEVFSIGYPRYPMNASEPILEAALVLVLLVIVLSGFWHRTIEDDKGLKNWRYVAGLKMFIEKMYKDRFYRDGKQIASEGDMHTFYPYAIALGIETRFADKLKRALVL